MVDSNIDAETDVFLQALREAPREQLLGEVTQKSSRPDMVHFSLDLTEATYNMSHELLDKQSEALDQLFSGFPPWIVFREVFTCFKREVDTTDLIAKGYFKGPEKVTTSCGSFMGDVMSFIHLTLFLRGAVEATKFGSHPIGQSVGDDLLLLEVPRKVAESFKTRVNRLGGKFSKINSISEDSITFCENYAVRPTDDKLRLGAYAKTSRFGDLFFLDIIKGSLMSGKSKVKTSGATPFLGHASMLNKQTAWHPLSWVKRRSKIFLWVTNYWHSAKLGAAMASLPRSLGGVDLAIGPQISIEDEEFKQNFLPYYDAIVRTTDEKVFFAFYTLLQGIFKAEPKGLPYENDLEVILPILSRLDIRYAGRDVNSLLPTFLHEKPIRERLRYLETHMSMSNIAWLVEEISRRQAFMRFWNSDNPSGFMTLPIKAPFPRWRAAWKEIRRNFDPLSTRSEYRTMAELAAAFDARCWNVYFCKEDPVIQEILGGCPSLYLSFGDHH